jgi:pullulanase/glycogen debranching enzyme
MWSTTTPPRAATSAPPSAFAAWPTTTTIFWSRIKALYKNYSGTGNTLNGNNTIVRRMILDSLRYWVREMHVDGFRFDLASILSRDEHGTPMVTPPVLWDIESDPVLAGTKLIAEAWDAGGLYQVGNFYGDHWKEWNGRFRDDVRAFVKSDPGMTEAVASRFFASPDIYGHKGREPEQSINFITCHDGFTLNDLVSYNHKHNLANGEQNRDGENHNLSWNCGWEGRQRRPGHGATAPAPDQEPADHQPAGPGRADALHGRRECGARNSATTTPTARTTRSVGSTGTTWPHTPGCTVSCACCFACASASTSTAR